MGDRRILVFKFKNRFFKWGDIFRAPIKIKKVAFFSALADSDNFHDGNIFGRQDFYKAVA